MPHPGQVVLTNASPAHQELLLLAFARSHNQGHSCERAIQTPGSCYLHGEHGITNPYVRKTLERCM